MQEDSRKEGPNKETASDVSPFRNSNFARIFWAGVASQSGSSVTNVVLVFLVYSITHSGLAVASIAISQTLAGVLFSLPSGTLVDRYERKRLMVLSDIVRAASIGFLGLFLVTLGFGLPVVAAVAFLVSGIGMVFQPAERALIPSLVSQDSISNANGLVYSSRSFISFAGSAIGGILIALVGTSASLFYNVLTFLISASLLYFIHGTRPPSSGTDGQRFGIFRETREGIRWLVRNAGLFQLTLSAMFLNFFATIATTFLVVYSSVALAGNSIIFGSLLGLFVAGSGIGSLLVGRTRALDYSGKVWLIGYGVVGGFLMLGLVLFPELEIALPMILAIGFSAGFVEITWLTTAQLVVPNEIQGRYFGIDALGSIAIIPLAQLAGGLLVDSRGVLFTYELAGVGMIITGLLFLLPKSLRNLRVERKLGG